MDKRGYIISYADMFKGFFFGLIVGGVLVYLFMNGIIKLPAGQPAQLIAAFF